MAGKRAEAIFWLRQNSLSDDVHGSTSSDKSTDITYIKLPSGNVYLMAIIDWYSRKVLSWQVFNTMDAGQYARLLRDTIEQYGCPAIFNTDQGAQFTSDVFTSVLIEYGIEISMDGRGRALDNIRIERLWRSLKYEGLFSAAKIARLKNTRVYLTANIVDYMCAIAHELNNFQS